ncbi:MAG: hypothetical protein HYT34_02255, partial [Candidatus Ryanbacteria bacterium]|nr:hypothetical protein [Candidatus Ryanbacteria bacterium]
MARLDDEAVVAHVHGTRYAFRRFETRKILAETRKVRTMMLEVGSLQHRGDAHITLHAHIERVLAVHSVLWDRDPGEDADDCHDHQRFDQREREARLLRLHNSIPPFLPLGS